MHETVITFGSWNMLEKMLSHAETWCAEFMHDNKTGLVSLLECERLCFASVSGLKCQGLTQKPCKHVCAGDGHIMPVIQL